MFSVMADTTPDVSNKDQLTVSVCYLDAADKPTERLLQVKEVTEKTGEGLANEILTSLAECKVDKEMMRFQTYDSAAQRRLEARPSMHCSSLIFTIVISCNVSWKSCGNLFRFFAKKISSF